MPETPKFDPVAASAVAGIQAADEGLRSVQDNFNLPELPGQTAVTDQSATILSQLAQMSPFTLLAEAGTPGAGNQSQGPLPNPTTLLDEFQLPPLPFGNQQAQSEVPNPVQHVHDAINQATGGSSGGSGGSSSSGEFTPSA